MTSYLFVTFSSFCSPGFLPAPRQCVGLDATFASNRDELFSNLSMLQWWNGTEFVLNISVVVCELCACMCVYVCVRVSARACMCACVRAREFPFILSVLRNVNLRVGVSSCVCNHA